jgi:hypothetical protein
MWCSGRTRPEVLLPRATGRAGCRDPAVPQHRPVMLARGTGWRAADPVDPEVAADAAAGASVVCTSVLVPRVRSGRSGSRCRSARVLAAAERTGALVVENLRGYGRAGGQADMPREKEKGHESH